MAHSCVPLWRLALDQLGATKAEKWAVTQGLMLFFQGQPVNAWLMLGATTWLGSCASGRDNLCGHLCSGAARGVRLRLGF